jgi:hypothetical protein
MVSLYCATALLATNKITQLLHKTTKTRDLHMSRSLRYRHLNKFRFIELLMVETIDLAVDAMLRIAGKADFSMRFA